VYVRCGTAQTIARTKQKARRRSAKAHPNLLSGGKWLNKKNEDDEESDEEWSPDPLPKASRRTSPLKRTHTQINSDESSASPRKRVKTRVRYTNKQKRVILLSYDQAAIEYPNFHTPQIFKLISDMHPALLFKTLQNFLRDRTLIEMSSELETHGVSEARVYV